MVRNAQCEEPDPGNRPPNCLFVPQSARSQVLQCVHASWFSCHPGIGRTLSLLKRLFWWLSMEADTQSYVLACTVCSRSNTSHRPPAVLLRPLPILGHPWSHIALNFVTRLPPSQGNKVILTIVRRFSRAAHLFALPKFPSTLETTELLVQHDSDFMGFPQTLYPTGGHNSFPRSGGPSTKPLVLQSVCPLVSILRLSVKLKEPIRSWKQPFAASRPPIPPDGALS